MKSVGDAGREKVGEMKTRCSRVGDTGGKIEKGMLKEEREGDEVNGRCWKGECQGDEDKKMYYSERCWN